MKASSLLRPEALVLLLCAAVALPPLVEAWRHAPLERWTAPSFFVWMAPAVWRLLARPGRGPLPELPGYTPFAGIALFLAAAGAVADFNVLNHAALACALAAFLPLQARTLLWLAAAPLWMPLTGVLTAGWPVLPLAFVRLLLCALAAGVLLFSRKPFTDPAHE